MEGWDGNVGETSDVKYLVGYAKLQNLGKKTNNETRLDKMGLSYLLLRTDEKMEIGIESQPKE